MRILFIIIIVGLLILVVNIILLVLIIKLIWRCSLPPKHDVNLKARIVGGVSVSNITDYQFAAAIVEIREESTVDLLLCGATVISRRWLLTAAHCIDYFEDNEDPKESVYITVGNLDWRKGNKHNLLSWVYHEEFDSSTLDNDIGLIRVKQILSKQYEQAISLASENYEYKPHTKARIVGWGHTNYSFLHLPSTEMLNRADIHIIEQRRCVDIYKKFGFTVTDSMFCAGTQEGGKDACKLDSGGAIFERGLLIGIISWGHECAKKDQPGVYVRINCYKNWIMETTKKLGAPLNIIKKKSEEISTTATYNVTSSGWMLETVSFQD
ncbi:hypothetical protein ILUMI_02157 [Ignelater luminosus]|uniref:Peptidase S1 domain-containing protein n=1 Tax=Ignelater luminosus TaxID=2038154 RepID=A0A8K0GGQ9_IGNLU|nr:hypothetical protein ILUMI_02157 [Ignelater luminosus]